MSIKNVTSQRTINSLVDMAFTDLLKWNAKSDMSLIIHAYSCLGNCIKLYKAELDE